MDVNSTVLQNMTPIKRKCFPLFSFMQFIAWLIPWPWACDLWIYSQASRETSSRGKSTILEAQTDESLLVNDNDLKYLTREEAEQIIERFEEIPRSYDRLLFWTGIPRNWAQRWADDHGMLTFSSAMGPLMDSTDKRCLRQIKKPKKWSKYIKGACGIFARYACKRGIVRVLTLPPYWAEFIRPQSTYRNIEEPVLKGKSGCCGAVQINAVYLLTTLEELEYQTWPENRIPERLSCKGVGSFSFRLPPWTQKAVDTAVKGLRCNVVSLTASSTPKPATVSVELQGSAKVAGEPPTVKQPKGGKESRINTNAQGILQSQCSQPRTDEQQPQSQQPQSKKKQQQTQLSQGKNQQLQSQQPQSKEQRPPSQQSSSKKEQPKSQHLQSKEKQPQTQQSPSKNKQPQIQLSQSKNQKPQTQQTSSKKKQPQTQQTSSKKEQPQTQQMSSKKKQPQTQQSSSKQQQPQTQQSPSKQRQPQKQQTSSKKKQPQIQKPQSNKPQPRKSKQPQQSKQPQSSRKLIIKAGA
jgi:hypothetical protein